MAGSSNRSRYQRRRGTPTYSNNSVRRTYDLLRTTLPALGPDAQLVEEELIGSFSASRNTIRVVLQILAAQGLVSRGPKVGTIATASMVIPLDVVMPIHDQGDGESHCLHGKVLESIVITAPSIVASRLQIPEGSPVAMIEGLMIDDSTPLALTVSYVALPPELGPELRRTDPDPISFLEEQLHVDVAGSDCVVAAIACDAQSAALLGLGVGDPILLCDDLFRDREGRPRAVTQTRFRGDRVTMSASARRRMPASTEAPSPPIEVVARTA